MKSQLVRVLLGLITARFEFKLIAFSGPKDRAYKRGVISVSTIKSVANRPLLWFAVCLWLYLAPISVIIAMAHNPGTWMAYRQLGDTQSLAFTTAYISIWTSSLFLFGGEFLLWCYYLVW